MTVPIPMARFAERGVGAKTLLRQYGYDSDFSGCYVLIDRKRPVYTGIARGVFRRLSQHVKGGTHYDASLAYRMAKSRCHRQMTRSSHMSDQDFRILFDEAKARIATMKVAYIEITNPLELYVFEAFCAMALDTHPLNTFHTH